jgi:hypothetical protein
MLTPGDFKPARAKLNGDVVIVVGFDAGVLGAAILDSKAATGLLNGKSHLTQLIDHGLPAVQLLRRGIGRLDCR